MRPFTLAQVTLHDRSDLANSLLTGALVIVGMLGLWWAQIQQQSIELVMGSTFEFPAGRWALWSLTIVAVGVWFGLAVAVGAGWRQRIRTSALLWGLVPLAMVLSFHLWVSDIMGFPRAFLEILVGIQMQVASAMAVGLFLAGLLAPMLPTPRPPEPEDV